MEKIYIKNKKSNKKYHFCDILKIKKCLKAKHKWLYI